MKRGTTLVVLIMAAAGLAACNGFPTLYPIEVARTKPPKPLVEETARVEPEAPAGVPREITDVAGRNWIVTAAERAVPATTLRPAGSVAARPIYVLSWDEPPYDRLFVPTRPGLYVEYREVWR